MLVSRRILLFLGRRSRPVTFTAGSASAQSGTTNPFTVDVPAIAAGTQFIDVMINSDTVTASLSGSGWSEVTSSASTAEPNRFHRYARSGPQSAGTITITLSSAVAANAYSWAANGTILGHAASISSYVNNPAAPSITAAKNGLVVYGIGPSSFPRQTNPPGGVTEAHDSWRYAGGGGIHLAVGWAQTAAAGSYSMGNFSTSDPDAGPDSSEFYRINLTALQPL